MFSRSILSNTTSIEICNCLILPFFSLRKLLAFAFFKIWFYGWYTVYSMVKRTCFPVLVEVYGLSDPNCCVYLYITLIWPKRKPWCLQNRFILGHDWETGLSPVGCNPDFQMLWKVFGDLTAVSENTLRRSCLQERTGLVCSLTTALLKSWL